MQTWEYKFLMCRYHEHWRPTVVDGEELADWQSGPMMFEYSNQLGDEGYTAREALAVLGMAVRNVSFLLLDRSKDDGADHRRAWGGDLTDVKVEAPLSQLIRQHRVAVRNPRQ